MALYFPYNFNGGNGGSSVDESNIQVFKSTDFDPIAYTVGNTTYYYPRVTFPGTKNGKILGIKAIDANGITRSFDPTYLMHFGMNLFSPLVTTGSWNNYKPDKIFSSYTTDGVTVTYLGDGGYSVVGTSTDAEGVFRSTRIGTVIDPVVGLWGAANDKKLPLDALNPYISCKNIQGTYEGLTIGGSFSADCCNPIDEEVILARKATWNYSSGSSYNTAWNYRIYYDIYLRWEGGKTYDCTFYPQITPKAIDNSYSKYEKTFCLNDPALMQMPIKVKPGLSEEISTSVSYSSGYITSISAYLSNPDHNDDASVTKKNNAGNASNFGIIKYPIVHSGLNTFVYGWPRSNQNDLIQLEVYYDPDYQGNTIKEELTEINYAINNGYLNDYIINGNWSLDASSNTSVRTDNKHFWLTYLNPLRYNSPYIPNNLLLIAKYTTNPSRSTGTYDEFSITDGGKQHYGIRYSDSPYTLHSATLANFGYDHNVDSNPYYIIDGRIHSIYFPKTAFYWSSPASTSYEKAFGLSIGDSTFTASSNVSCRIILDYNGWDDSPSFEQ